jgi:hypothetical protein
MLPNVVVCRFAVTPQVFSAAPSSGGALPQVSWQLTVLIVCRQCDSVHSVTAVDRVPSSMLSIPPCVQRHMSGVAAATAQHGSMRHHLVPACCAPVLLMYRLPAVTLYCPRTACLQFQVPRSSSAVLRHAADLVTAPKPGQPSARPVSHQLSPFEKAGAGQPMHSQVSGLGWGPCKRCYLLEGHRCLQSVLHRVHTLCS